MSKLLFITLLVLVMIGSVAAVSPRFMQLKSLSTQDPSNDPNSAESAVPADAPAAAAPAAGAPTPCDKSAAPALPKVYLDERLPHVVDDYHPPVGGFNPTDIPNKEVDDAARKILRAIQAQAAEDAENGVPSAGPPTGAVEMTTEEHKYLKQLLLDSDILVRAAAKALAQNGPVAAGDAKKVAASAVTKAAGLEKAAAKPAADAKKPAAADAKKPAAADAKKPAAGAKPDAKDAKKAETAAAVAAKKPEAAKK